MKSKKVKIQKIFPDKQNARLHSIDNINLLKASLKKHKQYSPLIIQKSTNKIIAGNGTYQAMLELDYTEVECIFLDIDNKTAKEIALIDNRSAELSIWDDENLCKLLIQLDNDEINFTGFNNDDIENLMNKLDIDDKSINPPVFYKCNRCQHVFNEEDGKSISNLKDE